MGKGLALKYPETNGSGYFKAKPSSSSSFSSSSGAEPPLIGGFGLLNDILQLCSILDTG